MLNLGKAIYTVLTGTTAIYSLVSNRIYPLVANENTPLPFIVYEKSINAEHTRDNNTLYTTNIDLIILAKDYKESITIGELILNKLNHLQIVIDGINIIDSRVLSVEETYDSNIYMQRLTFVIKSY